MGENDAVAPRRFSQVLENLLGERVTVSCCPTQVTRWRLSSRKQWPTRSRRSRSASIS